jgi:hypothetical protein
MSNNFENFRKALLSTGLSVSRDKAPKGSSYPYIVYSSISKGKKTASSKTFKRLPYYQVSLFTDGTEDDLKVLEAAFDEYGITYGEFTGIQGDENDDTVTNYFAYVRLIEDV